MNFTKWWAAYKQMACEELTHVRRLGLRWHLSAVQLREPGPGGGRRVRSHSTHSTAVSSQRVQRKSPAKPSWFIINAEAVPWRTSLVHLHSHTCFHNHVMGLHEARQHEIRTNITMKKWKSPIILERNTHLKGFTIKWNNYCNFPW